MTIALVDYGAGNLTSVRKAFAHLGADVVTPGQPGDLAAAAAIVVPGVGNFRATAALDTSWRRQIVAAVRRGTPLLGICLGLQWLFEGSTEAPDQPGLALLPGVCRRLEGPGLKIPHVGWNALHLVGGSWLLAGLEEGAQVYFTHSYAAPVGPACAATTTYGVEFAAAVEGDNIGGVQFHPEKSGEAGLRVLHNFLQRTRRARAASASLKAGSTEA